MTLQLDHIVYQFDFSLSMSHTNFIHLQSTPYNLATDSVVKENTSTPPPKELQPVHALTSYLCLIQFNIITQLLRLSSGSYPSGVFTKFLYALQSHLHTVTFILLKNAIKEM